MIFERPDSITVLLAAVSFLFFSYIRGLVYLRYFQQEEYDALRFFRWMWQWKTFDKRGTLAILVAYLCYVFTSSLYPALLLFTVLFFILWFSQKDPRKVGKIKLNMTARASRIYSVANVLFLALFFFFAMPCLTCYTAEQDILERFLLGALICVHLLPVSIVLGNFLLSPFEKRTKQKYYNEAKEILARVDPFVIGITGSYGKTSVKAALGEVLNAALAPTFYPPRSINTVMGITREIRERMTEQHKYAVIEMGAYNVGSIKRLCDFTPPNAGLVTVVGMAHLERYGSVEAVYRAKSELPQAVPEDGLLVCNGDNEGARRMTVEYPKSRKFLYGFNKENGELDCYAKNVAFTLEGTNFEIEWNGETHKGFTKLHGRPALENLLGVFTMACALGADPAVVLASIRNLEPVNNRLELKREGEIYFLNDAYNSNPLGFAAALDVLAELPAQRKILMTPGMVELGDEQYPQNKDVAEKAAAICDLVLLVGDVNLQALKDGLAEGELAGDAIVICKTREEAFEKLHALTKAGDMVLIENDLPDLYEVEERF